MADPSDEAIPPPAPEPVVHERPRRARWSFPRALAAIIVVLIVVVGTWAWRDAKQGSESVRSDFAERLAASDAALAQAKQRETDLANEVAAAQAKIAALEGRIAESQAQQASLETLYRELAPSRDELALAEVEQVLIVAQQQLALSHDTQAALAALKLVDVKLARGDRRELAPVRRALAQDMEDLKASPSVDVATITGKLEGAIGSIDTLALARDERVPGPSREGAEPTESAWMRFLRDTWTDVKSIVRIEATDRAPAPLVAPTQAYFLKENLRLRLLSARIALLSGDDKTFKRDVAQASAWLRDYYDARAPQVQAMSATLAALAATPMPAKTPDLNRSLEAVRAQRFIGTGGSAVRGK
jgi:uroporphyrin-3 C-methyltransferase